MLHAWRGFSTSASSSGPESTSGTQEKKTDSILDFNQANEHCKNSVKKFDFYSYRVATHLPVSSFAKEIHAANGIAGFYKGIQVNIMRACVLNATKMGCYDVCKTKVKQTGIAKDGIPLQFLLVRWQVYYRSDAEASVLVSQGEDDTQGSKFKVSLSANWSFSTGQECLEMVGD